MTGMIALTTLLIFLGMISKWMISPRANEPTFPSYAIIETRDDHVCVLHSEVGVGDSVHTEHMETFLVVHAAMFPWSANWDREPGQQARKGHQRLRK